MLDTLIQVLSAQSIPHGKDVPMAKWTTMRVGGPADLLVEARSAQDIACVVSETTRLSLPLLVIGNGSNLLVRDGGIRGVVLVIGDQMKSVSQDGTQLHVQGGATLTRAARRALDAGLSGLEALSGIPGTVGGGAYMNAGAYGTEFSQVVSAVHALDASGTVRVLERDALQYGYRTSALMQQQLIVTDVCFALQPDDKEAIATRMADYAKRRRDKQPLSKPSAGSFFKRPEGAFAGALIEQAGLKGMSIGGAEVSQMHAGFLINKGNATASDLLALMVHVQETVHAMSGIMLEPEVRILGCDSYC